MFLLDPLAIKTPSIHARTLELSGHRNSSIPTVYEEFDSLDAWPSKAVAQFWLAQRAPWKHWDSRFLELFGVRECLYFRYDRRLTSGYLQEHGLRARSQSSLYPDPSVNDVELSCPTACKDFVLDNAAEHAVASEIMASLSTQFPVHVVFGEDSPYWYVANETSVNYC